MINIDKYAHISKLKHTAPMKKLVFSMLSLGTCLWADSIIVSILVLLVMGWLTVLKGGIPIGLFIKLMLVPASFLVIGVLTIGISVSVSNDAFLFSLHGFGMYMGVTQASIQKALHLFFKSLGAVSSLYYLSLSTPMVDLLAALGKLKVPKLLTELMGLIYRFIFVLLETTETMFTAQNSRLGYSDLFTSYRSLAALASTLFIRSYKRADDLYTALETRGYDGELNVLEEEYAAKWTEYIPPVMLNVFFIVIALILKRYLGGFN